MADNNHNFNNYRNSEDDEITIDLLELFLELLRHWKLIVFLTLLLGGVAFGYCKLIAVPIYKSTSELYVLNKTNNDNTTTSLSDLQVGSNLSDDYVVVLSGHAVLEQVSENLGLEMTYEELSDKVTIDTLSDRIIRISAKDADPNLAKEIAVETANVAAAYIHEKMDQDPPSIIESGYMADEPVFPRTKRTTVLAAMLGFLMAAAIVIVRYLLNDTIMTAEDVEKKLGMTVLGTLPLVETELNSNRSSGRNSNKKSKKNKKNKR